MLHFAERLQVPIGRFQYEQTLQHRKQAIDSLALALFGTGATRGLPQHSEAVSINDYDNYEEDHPFYGAMHDCMLSAFKPHTEPAKSLTVLEVGAGTGHFTKRLIGLVPNLRIIALEPDGPACNILRHKFAPKRKSLDIIECEVLDFHVNEKVRCVFSSFADHHIRPAEKKKYFEHLKQLLEPGGFIVIGDEFLRSYSEEIKDYEKAVQDYHEYIIGLAAKQDRPQFIELEKAALRSGLADDKSRVDFKVSVDDYKKFIDAGGLDIVQMTCVSDPAVADRVGGMFVFVLKPRKP